MGENSIHPLDGSHFANLPDPFKPVFLLERASISSKEPFYRHLLTFSLNGVKRQTETLLFGAESQWLNKELSLSQIFEKQSSVQS